MVHSCVGVTIEIKSLKQWVACFRGESCLTLKFQEFLSDLNSSDRSTQEPCFVNTYCAWAFSFEHVKNISKKQYPMNVFSLFGKSLKSPKFSIQSFPSFKLPHSGTPQKGFPKTCDRAKSLEGHMMILFLEFGAHRTLSGEPWFRASNTHICLKWEETSRNLGSSNILVSYFSRFTLS